MNLANNIIALRKKLNISQEELAEKLDVTRQAVSKWESGNGYPEIEKLIKLSEVFNCSLDILIKGEIKEDNKNDLEEYDKLMHNFGIGISLGLFFILVGTTLFLIYLGIVPSIKDKEIAISLSLLLTFSFISVPFFIINSLKMDSYKKKHKEIINTYTNEEINKFEKRFAIIISSCITIMIIGVISLILMYGLETYNNNILPLGFFMIYITLAVPVLTYYGIQKEKYNKNKYDKTNSTKINKQNELIGKICSIIMIITTIIYLILGFIFNLWHISRLIFVISGMVCGIVAIILNKEELNN